MRSFVALGMAALLAGCATAQPEQKSNLQNAVFIAGDSSAPVQATVLNRGEMADPKTAEDSTLKRLSWFFSGR